MLIRGCHLARTQKRPANRHALTYNKLGRGWVVDYNLQHVAKKKPLAGVDYYCILKIF